MSPIEREIVKTERDLEAARVAYQRANARRNMNEAMRWGSMTRQLIQRLEQLGTLHDEGRSAFAIARS